MAIPKGLVRWGRRGLLVQPEVREALQQIKEVDNSAFMILWDTFTQGYGFAKASGRTHSDGYAVDFSVNDQRYNATVCKIILRHLNRRFAVVLRYQGELGPTNPAHIHAALRPYSNSAAIDRLQRGGKTFAKQVAKVFPQADLIAFIEEADEEAVNV